MMSRNDFEILARHLKAMYPDVLEHGADQSDIDYRDGYNTAINQVAGACSSVNPRFDADKFKAAIGHRCTHDDAAKLLEEIDDAGLGRQA